MKSNQKGYIERLCKITNKKICCKQCIYPDDPNLCNTCGYESVANQPVPLELQCCCRRCDIDKKTGLIKGGLNAKMSSHICCKTGKWVMGFCVGRTSDGKETCVTCLERELEDKVSATELVQSTPAQNTTASKLPDENATESGDQELASNTTAQPTKIVPCACRLGPLVSDCKFYLSHNLNL